MLFYLILALTSFLFVAAVFFLFQNSICFTASIPEKLTLQQYEEEVQKLKLANPNWKIPPSQKNLPKELRSYVAEDLQEIKKKFENISKENK
eukprot:UN24387